MRSASASSNAVQVHTQRAKSLPNISPRRVASVSGQRGVSTSAAQPPVPKKSLLGRAVACVKKTVASVVKNETFGKVLNVIGKVACIGAAIVSIAFPPAALVTGIVAASITLLGVLRDVAVTVKNNKELAPKDRVSLGSLLLSSAIGVATAFPIGNVLSIVGTAIGALTGGIGCVLSASRENRKLKDGGIATQGWAASMGAMSKLPGLTGMVVGIISAAAAGVGYAAELIGGRSPKKHSESAGVQNQTA